MKRTAPRMLAALALIGTIHFMQGAPARAQFEIVTGTTSCREAAYKGVQELNGTTCSGGTGAIAAGVSFSTGSGCGDADAYVVRYTLGGGVTWQNNYDIQGNGSHDSAMSVTQVDDGFIVTGITTRSFINTDIFIMKLNCDGTVAWTKTYGDERIDFAFDVIVATTGNGTRTNAGDIVVCGYTKDSDSLLWGYLLRTSSTGVIVWDSYYTYPPPLAGATMLFHSLIEATPTGAATTGDIVTVGWTDCVGPNPPVVIAQDAVAMRVNGNNGQFTGALHAFATYGGVHSEQFTTVIEHSGDIDSGGVNDLIFAGWTTYGGGSAQRDIYIVNCPGDPCNIPANAQEAYGDGALGVDWEAAHSMVEASGTGTPGPGDVVMTGYNLDANPLNPNQRQAILLAVPSGLNAAPTLARRYGAVTGADEYGNSIWELAGGGWLIAGSSNSMLTGVADPDAMYLLRTDATGLAGTPSGHCTHMWNPSNYTIRYHPDCYTVTPVAVELSEDEDTETISPGEVATVCPRTLFKTNPLGNAYAEVARGSFPNPVLRGENVTVDLSSETTITLALTCVNSAGVVVRTIEVVPGSRYATIATTNLPSGLYKVFLSDEKSSGNLQFTVIE